MHTDISERMRFRRNSRLGRAENQAMRLEALKETNHEVFMLWTRANLLLLLPVFLFGTSMLMMGRASESGTALYFPDLRDRFHADMAIAFTFFLMSIAAALIAIYLILRMTKVDVRVTDMLHWSIGVRPPSVALGERIYELEHVGQTKRSTSGRDARVVDFGVPRKPRPAQEDY